MSEQQPTYTAWPKNRYSTSPYIEDIDGRVCEFSDTDKGLIDAHSIAKILNEVPDLLAENQRLREALEFYADKDNYDSNCAAYHWDLIRGQEKIELDEGRIAREALGKTK